jgi:hypothetical protein
VGYSANRARAGKISTTKALDAYLQLARNGNCVAQTRIANAYAAGTLVQKNLTQAYFWNLLARVSEWSRKSNVDYDSARGISYSLGDAKPCGEADHFSADVLEIKIKAHKLLPAELEQAAEDAATHWTKGAVENLLPAPADNCCLVNRFLRFKSWSLDNTKRVLLLNPQ